MKHVYFRFFLATTVLFGLLLGSRWGYAVQKIIPSTDSTKRAKSTLDTHPNKPADLNVNRSLKVPIVPLGFAANKIGGLSNSSQLSHLPDISSANNADDSKILSSVLVYPNPIPASEQLHVTYRINKDADVTIKLMDVLGSEITTFLPSEREAAGEWTESFQLPSRLQSGMSYFVEVIAGKEIVVKRISII